MESEMMITATYSPEDNKIRLYPSARLDSETFARVKAAGFKWAPKQELFVAPAWSPKREDLAVELAGEIEPEQMTLAERAAEKAARLDGYAERRQQDANRFARMADELARQFEGGQPILVGHHSERKARKAQERLHSAMERAAGATRAANYWLYRADGVEAHANRKNDPATRARRIKTLLSELRDVQRNLNHCNAVLSFWDRVTDEETIRRAVNMGQIATGPLTSYGDYSAMEKGEKTPAQIRQESIDRNRRTIDSGHWQRWIAHTLNRLSYERELLGHVARHEGALRETAIQMFAREHGAFKPKATATDVGYVLESPVPLPAHFANGKTLELSADEWRDMMSECGYSVPAENRNAKPPILNFRADSVVVQRWGRNEALDVIERTKAEYMKRNSEYRGTFTSADGAFRVRVMIDPRHTGPAYQAGWVAVFLSDSKEHPTPESESVCLAGADA